MISTEQTNTELTAEHVRAFARRLRGEVIQPDDEAYEDARLT